MKSFLLNLLNIEEAELGQVLLLLASSFFLGIFISSYDVVSSTLFLDNTVLVEKWLSRALIVSAITGGLASAIFSYLQDRIPFIRLVIIFLTLFLFFVISIKVVVDRHVMWGWDKEIVDLIPFVFLGPMNTIALLCFYGTVSRAFNLRQQRRITGKVDQGGMFATAIAFFGVLLITQYQNFAFFKWLNGEHISNFFIVSAIALTVTIFLVIIFNFRYGSDRLRKIQRESTQAKTAHTAKGRSFITAMGLMVLVSVLAVYFVDYSFLLSTSKQFQNNQSDLSGFIAGYGVAMTLFSVLFQIFGGDRIIQTIGDRNTLLILPILIGGFTLISALLGIAFQSPIEPGFVLFFIFIALSKLFFQTLLEAFEEPMLKEFFLALDKKVRHRTETLIDGVFRQSSGIFAGLILFLITASELTQLYIFSIILSGIFIAYFFFMSDLYKKYRDTLLSTLDANKGSKDGDISGSEKYMSQVLKHEIETTEKPGQLTYTYSLMEHLDPLSAEDHGKNLLENKEPEVQKFGLRRAVDNAMLQYKDLVSKIAKENTNADVKHLASEALLALSQTEYLIEYDSIVKLARSAQKEDRELAARLIAYNPRAASVQVLFRLLKDNDVVVRRQALLTAGKTKKVEFWTPLIEGLSSPLFFNVCFSSIIRIGEPIILILDMAFYKTGQTSIVMERIIQLFGHIGGEQAIECLLTKIDYPDKRMVNQVLYALSNLKYQARDKSASRVRQALQFELSNVSWNFAALKESEALGSQHVLQKALEEEIEQNIQNIFLLMGLIFDTASVELVREQTESEDADDIVYALELLDVFLSDELKPLVFPVLDDLDLEERIQALQQTFPRPQYALKELLIQLLNRDFNLVNRWTKAVALYTFSQLEDADAREDIVAQLFNPDLLIAEVAALTLFKLSPAHYHRLARRLDEEIAEHLTALITQTGQSNIDRRELKIEKVLFIMSCKRFDGIKGLVLAELADMSEEIVFEEGITLVKDVQKANLPIFIIETGEVQGLNKQNEITLIAKDKEVLGVDWGEDMEMPYCSVRTLSDASIYVVNRSDFFELLSRSGDLTKEIINRTKSLETI